MGGVLLCRYITETWNSQALLPLILTCSVPTTLIEASIMLANKILL
jgi:1,4-dihydroxy-2-naphthoate octaprenyltransferase